VNSLPQHRRVSKKLDPDERTDARLGNRSKANPCHFRFDHGEPGEGNQRCSSGNGVDCR